MGFKQDGGYGPLGNRSKKSFLENFLNEEQRKDYERKLEREDPEKYREFKEWLDIPKKRKEYLSKIEFKNK